MSSIVKRKNPNTKQFWENIYENHIDQKKIRSGAKLRLEVPC